MTRFRVPAASVLTLLLAAANLLGQTFYGPSGPVRPTNVELEVQQLPLGTSVTCASFQPVAVANYLLSWTGLWQQGRYCEAEAAAKQACEVCPANLAAKHALVVSQLVNALQCEASKCDSEKHAIRITCEIKCGGSLSQALEASCGPILKLFCNPSSDAWHFPACPALTQVKCAECGMCCEDVLKNAVPTASKASCGCGDNCACAKKPCACGADCACKEADKKAQKRAARRALAVRQFVLPPHLDGDLPLPMRPVFVPMAPMHPVMPMASGSLCPAPVVCPMPTDREQQLCAQELAILQAARFENAPIARPTPRVHLETAGLEVQCDRLTRMKDGRIVCEGDVCMTLRREHHPSKILAERIVINPEDGCFEVGSRCEIDKPIARP